jgi:hypothetical protein
MNELDTVVLTVNLNGHGLKNGDIGTVVLVHNEPLGYEIEFTTLTGDTVAVVSLLPDQLRPISPGEIAHARRIADAA